MARARNIKPAFFINEDLAEIEPIGRLLFIGLWTIADYKGDLEWRPKRIKAQLLPYDNCDIEEIMINLDKSRFVTFYSVSGKTYIHINNFLVHQHPHPNENKKGSDIPKFDNDGLQVVDSNEVTINHDKSRQVTSNSITNQAGSFNPDPLILIPNKTPLSESKIPPCPHEKIIGVYHGKLPTLNKTLVARWSGSTKAKDLQARWRESEKHRRIEFWEWFFDSVKTNPHWMGENDRGWKADLGWLLKRANFDKVIERGANNG